VIALPRTLPLRGYESISFETCRRKVALRKQARPTVCLLRGRLPHTNGAQAN